MVRRSTEIAKNSSTTSAAMPWVLTLNKEEAQTEPARRGWAATAQARQLLDAAAVRWRLHVGRRRQRSWAWPMRWAVAAWPSARTG